MGKFSFIVKVRRTEPVNRLLDNLKKQQQISFEEDIQVILADTIGTMESKEVLEAFSNMENVAYLACPGMSLCGCVKEAKQKITGQYVSVITEDCMYEEDALSAVESVFEPEKEEDAHLCEVKAVSLSPVFLIPGMEGRPYQNQPAAEKEGLLKLGSTAGNLQLMLQGYFFKRDFFNTIEFDETALMEEGKYMAVLDAACRMDSYYFLASKHLYYETCMEDFNNLYEDKRMKEWYTQAIRSVYIPFAQKVEQTYGKIPDFVAAPLVYLLYNRFEMNRQERNLELLEGEELDEFLDVCVELLSHVSYECVLQNLSYGAVKLRDFLRMRFMEQIAEKYNRPYETYHCKGAFFYRETENAGEAAVGELKEMVDYSRRWIKILAMNVEEEILVIDGVFQDIPLLDKKNIKIFAKVNGVKEYVKTTRVYNVQKYFGRVFYQDHSFQLTVNLQDVQDLKITFFVKTYLGTIRPLLRFSNMGSRISESVEGSYWNMGQNRVLTYQKNRLEISVMDDEKLHLMEQNLQHRILLTSTEIQKAQKCVELRKKYFAVKDKFKDKNIWVTFDRLYKGGDNGEYIFRYISDNCPDIDIYYIIKENSPDYTRLKKKYKNLLIYGTEEARLMCLLAKAILTTHTMVYGHCDFEQDEEYFRDIFSGEVICIQHGLTVQDMTPWQNRLRDNLRLYTCASPYEIENLQRPAYGYKKGQLVMTGLARYDGLKSVKEKQILISPTWRRKLVNARIGNNEFIYNPHFKESEYYRVYNRLIHDERLLACARKNGYRILYLLHPAMSGQLSDFESNDVVTVEAATKDVSYEYVLTHSDVMVTDYSGIQFDFAYMRKPILYYHPESLPNHYSGSEYFKYDEMGFGPVVESHDVLVDELVELMENGCSNKNEYLERANDFFAYDDFNNCKRIYEAIRKYLKKRGAYSDNPSQIERIRRKLWKKR